jgi:carbon-monoxide dehydrogenase medium subunit
VRHAAFHRKVVDSPLGALLTARWCIIRALSDPLRGTFCGSLAHGDRRQNGAPWRALDAELVAISARGGAASPRATSSGAPWRRR